MGKKEPPSEAAFFMTVGYHYNEFCATKTFHLFDFAFIYLKILLIVFPLQDIVEFPCK